MSISSAQTYEILAMEDTSFAVEVPWNSTANCAITALHNRNDSNAQKWLFENYSGDIWFIKDAETGKCAEILNGTGQDFNGARVTMFTANQSIAQQWKAVRIGTETINGTAYETYQFIAFGGTTSTPRVMDVQGEGAYIGANVVIMERVVGHPSQTFALVPTEWNAIGGTGNEQTVLPTPANGAGYDGTNTGEFLGVDSGTVYPVWQCPETLYQVRYRMRKRAAGASTVGAWSDWKSISDGSNGFFGWGAVGQSNCTPVSADGLKRSPSGVSVDNSTTYDRTDIQFGARAWRSDWGVGSTASAHGGDSTWTVTTVREVSISQLDMLLTADGLKIGWVTDATRGGATVTLDCELFDRWTGISDASGSATIDHVDLTRLPEVGDVVPVSISYKTADGLEVIETIDATVSYEGSHGAGLTISSTVTDTIATITASDAGAKVWLVITEGHATRYVALTGEQPWKCAPPIGVAWQVLGTVGDSSTWASKLQTFPAIQDANIHVTSQDLTRDLVIIGGLDGAPAANPSYGRSVENFEVSGRERPVYIPKQTTEQQITVEGALFGDDTDIQRATFDWFVHAGHAHLRLPNGFWAQVCILGGDIERIVDEAFSIELNVRGEQW